MKTMSRTERLKRACDWRKKRHVAQQLGVSAPFFSYLYHCKDLDRLIARIDALKVTAPKEPRAAE